MIASLKVYETLYQNDVHEILYVMIIKSKFSDNFVKNVLLPYLDNAIIWHKNTKNGFEQDTHNHFQTNSEAFFGINGVLRPGFDSTSKIMLRLPN